MSYTFQPESHFYVDHTAIALPVAANAANDSFGPVSGFLNTKYRTSSKLRASVSSPVKVYAICDGQILIQPQTDDTTKVNLILKPTVAYSPLKIKYFIYRGVNKSDLLNSNILKPVDNEDLNQPIFLRELWKEFIDFNMPFYENGTISNPPETFPAMLIGYDENQSGDTLIEHYFTRKGSQFFYQIPSCKAGQHIGNFNEIIGLDIVLDYGDYELVNQQELFKLNLDFARKTEYVFDTATLASPTAVNVKRYREHILQFLDAAAFWGSHIGSKIIIQGSPSGISANNDIYGNLVNKYQTKNKVYFYIHGEKNRSYNYYDNTRKFYGLNTAGQLSENNSWPITIEEITEMTAPASQERWITFNLEYNIDSRINEMDRQISVDIVAPYNDTYMYPYHEQPLNPILTPPATLPINIINKSKNINLKFAINGTKSCASFVFIYANLKLEYPLNLFYNELWPVNFTTTFEIPNDLSEASYSATFDKSRMVNANDLLNMAISVQNKIVYDKGLSQAQTGPNVPKRQLYIASIKRNSRLYRKSLNIDTLKVSIAELRDRKIYFDNVYDDDSYEVYQGTFNDAGSKKSLVLTHKLNFDKKFSYFNLGITEQEYNKLIYDSSVVPTVTPPQTTIPQLLPNDADNVFFFLEEIFFGHENLRKFRIGLEYEDNTGSRVTVFPTSPINDVTVYSADGYYFFSSEYSNYQQFTSEFAKTTVDFRTTLPDPSTTPPIVGYNGEFGFDWIRDGDNFEPLYKDNIVTGYERPTVADPNTEFETKAEAFKAFKREYNSIPTQKVDQQYFISYLNLFSQQFSSTISTNPVPPYVAELSIFLDIDENINKLEFDYDSTIFHLDKTTLSDNTVTTPTTPSGHTESVDHTVKITCLQDFSETSQIKILAYPLGATDIKDAQLAGLILVARNDAIARKTANILLVNVHTDVDNDGIEEKGIYFGQEVLNLKNILYQDYIYGNIQTGAILDLTGDNQFKQQYTASGVPKDGGFINSLGGVATNNFTTGIKIHQYLKDAFLNPANSRYNNYFLIFSFNLNAYSQTVFGHVDKIGSPLVVVYKHASYTDAIPRDNTTLNHETMHGYGLRHTHRDGAILATPLQKYIFPKADAQDPLEPTGVTYGEKATDNVMSYNSNAITLWQWQRRFINLRK